MSYSLQQEQDHLQTDYTPFSIEFDSVHNALDSFHLDEDTKHVPPLSGRFLCTICVDEPDSPLEQARLPECSHTFCLPCLASWSVIRQLCPNCKAPFQTVLSRRALDGSAVQGPVDACGEYPQHELPISALRDAPWLPLHEIHSPQHDIEASFELPPRYSSWSAGGFSSSSAMDYHLTEASPAPYYAHEDFEDELEDRFWQEEEQAHQRLMRTSRSISNRRYGHGGYLASGRMRATPCLNGNSDDNNSNGRNGSEVHGKSSTSRTAMSGQGASCPNTSHKRKPKPPQSHRDGASPMSGNGAPTGRKKKLKKKSRAGIAAAKAAAENRVNSTPISSENSESVGSPCSGSHTTCG